MLAARRVPLRAQVAHSRNIAQRAERMPKTLFDEQALSGFGVQLHRIPLPERGRANSDVDHHIQDASVEALHVFRLPGRNVGEVNPAHRASPRHRNVHLRQVKITTDGFGKHT